MNSYIENAICVTTWDETAGRPSPASLSCGRWVRNEDDAVVFDGDSYGEDSAHQELYRTQLREEELDAPYTDGDTRYHILEEI